jgi:hypothetical protein
MYLYQYKYLYLKKNNNQKGDLFKTTKKNGKNSV